MPRSVRIKRLTAALVAVGLTLHLAACGTILHPERRGQPPGRLDPGIVVLDAVGLLLFFIPGVIAFAVDFSNGTIYLPPEYGAADFPTIDATAHRTVRMSPAEITPQRLAEVVQEKTGREIRLEPGSYRAVRVENISGVCDETLERLRIAEQNAAVTFPRP